MRRERWHSAPRLTRGLWKSSNGLQGLLQTPISDPLQCRLITGHARTSRDGALTTHTQGSCSLLTPWEVCTCVWGWRGAEVASLPLGNPPCPGSPTQAGSGAKVTPYPVFLPGNFPPRLPQGLCEGARSASEKTPVGGILLQVGPPWRQSCLPVSWEVSSTLDGAAAEGLRMLGPRWGRPSPPGVPWPLG